MTRVKSVNIPDLLSTNFTHERRTDTSPGFAVIGRKQILGSKHATTNGVFRVRFTTAMRSYQQQRNGVGCLDEASRERGRNLLCCWRPTKHFYHDKQSLTATSVRVGVPSDLVSAHGFNDIQDQIIGYGKRTRSGRL